MLEEEGAAIELSALLALPTLRDPFDPAILRELLDNRRERALRDIGLGREARRIQSAKRQIARKWLQILEDRKHDVQMERCARRKPHPDLFGYELRFRTRMLQLRLLLSLHFAGVRGLEDRCQCLIRPLVAAVRPECVIPFPVANSAA